MDQQSFRRLLETPKPGTSIQGPSAAKPKAIDASQPAFKPRKVKKVSESRYRNRAAERRHGGGNDYAEVEAVLEEFQKRHADADKEEMEEKRKYLGGDSDHSILVKGLDMALLEANKAKATALTEDDDVLEKAFAEEDIVPEAETVTKKRTREDLLRELKEKRGEAQTPNNHTQQKTAEEDVKLLEEAKKAGKFKPIGFKPITEEKPKKKKVKNDAKEGERKKKKRKVEGQESSMIGQSAENDAQPSVVNASPAVPEARLMASMPKVKTPKPEPKPLPDDFNIFGDVGEYEEPDLGDDEEEEHVDTKAHGVKTNAEELATTIPQRWIAMDEDELPDESSNHQQSPPHQSPRSPIRGAASFAPQEEDMEQEKAARLEPLASSSLPSIKDFLAMQGAAEEEEKRQKRKEKKKAKAPANK
ncbi:hypothetical protein M378DRAFT_176190 [Amanita muscaria Koide BX008]|uniref:RED-like N-terminal domain-containing protein n=1 Tax=Amanita muscaria (strain Koide BX008) TaxID=946122 RepID=A0A0C2XIH7_AMAMK|nr:hypothetical protein M378DRAFT_176190 [Amanita muscaria Koide BX008]